MNNMSSENESLFEPRQSMSTGGTEEVNSVLAELNQFCPDIQLSMVSTQDGLTMSALGAVIDPDQVGAMCTELLAVCNKAARELERGELNQMVMRCSNGCLFLMPAGDQAVLAIMTIQNVNLGMVIIEAERAAMEINNLL
ncbi:MAG: roadblock/LC7 domain-containing protein [Gammaproteobacteria bacterium]|nr:roadblock/LC7 domain-containing protein [Gammaproteobacteria bacterium]MDH5735938.1 roadblock/LC7 domain-containing protein [Gammaproteobacteria bacterium]